MVDVGAPVVVTLKLKGVSTSTAVLAALVKAAGDGGATVRVKISVASGSIPSCAVTVIG